MNALFRRLRRTPDRSTGVTFASVGRSHVGRVRAINEDRIFDRSDIGLWAVADGMGGHHGGALAAEAVTLALAELEMSSSVAATIDRLKGVNGEILARCGTDESGTTVVALHADGASATLIWAGDSRAYLIRDGEVRQLTRDHSLVQEMVDAGLLNDEQAANHPRANVITRALGIGADLDIDRTSLTLRPGDRILLCSDGLSRSLDRRDFRSDLTLDAQADRLLTNALQRDGSDNVSLVLIALT